jgi:hypothetical protein
MGYGGINENKERKLREKKKRARERIRNGQVR